MGKSLTAQDAGFEGSVDTGARNANIGADHKVQTSVIGLEGGGEGDATFHSAGNSVRPAGRPADVTHIGLGGL